MVVVRDRQTLADAAVEHCGLQDAMFSIMRENGIPADANASGSDIEFPKASDEDVVGYIARTGVSPANAPEDEGCCLTDDDGDSHITTETNEDIEYEV